MDGGDQLVRRRKSLKERLGLKAINCCGGAWGLMPPAMMTVQDDGEEEEEIAAAETESPPPENSPEPPCAAAPGMNLAAALAAERQFRAGQESDDGQSQSQGQSTPLRVSLMRLLEETDGGCNNSTTSGAAAAVAEKENAATRGSDWVCCVCMVRKKGAAFIPCGHTFCRVCSREVWLIRGCCPLCNRSILEILDIY